MAAGATGCRRIPHLFRPRAGRRTLYLTWGVNSRRFYLLVIDCDGTVVRADRVELLEPPAERPITPIHVIFLFTTPEGRDHWWSAIKARAAEVGAPDLLAAVFDRVGNLDDAEAHQAGPGIADKDYQVARAKVTRGIFDRDRPAGTAPLDGQGHAAQWTRPATLARGAAQSRQDAMVS